MADAPRTCSKCATPTMVLRKTTIRPSGVTRRYACTSCGQSAYCGTWGNVGWKLALALVIMPAILYFHPAYTLSTVPPMFFVVVVVFLGMAGFEVYRLKKFDTDHPAMTT